LQHRRARDRGLGTALGAVIKAWSQGKKIHVYVDETRPLLQGGRLTTWNSPKNKIPYTLIATIWRRFSCQKEKSRQSFRGSDRIAVNGDFANKNRNIQPRGELQVS